MAGEVSEPELPAIIPPSRGALLQDDTRVQSDNNNINGPSVNNNPATTNNDHSEPLYFTKGGKPQFGVTPPAAFAISYPYPPLPSNLAKNRVLRALDDHSKEDVEEGITQAEQEFAKEAMPLPGLAEVCPLPKLLIPQIELAIYWDRHPYEFRAPEMDKDKNKSEKKRDSGRNSSAGGSNKVSVSGSVGSSTIIHNTKNNSDMRRSKSEMNLASKVGEILLEEDHGRRSSVSMSEKSSRLSGVTGVSSIRNLMHNNHQKLRAPSPSLSILSKNSRQTNKNIPMNPPNKNIPCAGNGQCNSTRNSATSNHNLQMSESERKKFQDINKHDVKNQNHVTTQITRPKLIRTQDQLSECSKKSAGVQVTLDDVAAAALKSTYLCPLHGQYQRGIERRDKSGFRTNMGSDNNVHAHCSRALKGIPSRTKMIKTAETQTDDELGGKNRRPGKRSKTAGHRSAKGKDIMASEYHGSYKNPYKIADSEKRHLRNKILNYCFTKHSVF